MWTISPSPYSESERNNVWRVRFDGYLYSFLANYSYDIYPTIYLSSNIRLSGTGEQGANSYKIIES